MAIPHLYEGCVNGPNACQSGCQFLSAGIWDPPAAAADIADLAAIFCQARVGPKCLQCQQYDMGPATHSWLTESTLYNVGVTIIANTVTYSREYFMGSSELCNASRQSPTVTIC